MADLPQLTPWSRSSFPNAIALVVGDYVVRRGSTLPVVGIIASMEQDHAYVEWRDGSSDWSRQAALRGAPSWWC